MFLTNEKKKHSTWQGTFYTRKWNDITPVVYFEKLYGGKPLLKKINQFAIQENLTFNSSMIDESNAVVWQLAGWQVLEKLNVLSLDLKNIKKGELFSSNNIKRLRPGNGLSPIFAVDFL